MKSTLEKLITRYVANYPSINQTETSWGRPVLAFASSNDPLFYNLKNLVHKDHLHPRDLLPNAKTVICYFVPFTQELEDADSAKNVCSPKWAKAYVETNSLIDDINLFIQRVLGDLGYDTVPIPATHNFDQSLLTSTWSHRHVAHIAGLGTFGRNNMLITEKGCLGRVCSLITNIAIPPDERPSTERCLSKIDGSCNLCLENCEAGSLSDLGFDSATCYEKCMENAALYSDIGFADVCGKCMLRLPCSLNNPIRTL